MACTKRYPPWPKEWIEALHAGRKIVDGRPLKTYREIAEELGTTLLRVQKAAQRYGATCPEGKNTRRFSDSEMAEIKRILEHGVEVRLMCARELRHTLAGHGYWISLTSIRRYIKECGVATQRQYQANVLRKRRSMARLATRRRLAKLRGASNG